MEIGQCQVDTTTQFGIFPSAITFKQHFNYTITTEEIMHIHSLITRVNEGKTVLTEFEPWEAKHFGSHIDEIERAVKELHRGDISEIRIDLSVYCHKVEKHIIESVEPFIIELSGQGHLEYMDSRDVARMFLDFMLGLASMDVDGTTTLPGGHNPNWMSGLN